MTLQTLDTYCSISDVKNLFSAVAVHARLDDVCEIQKVRITGTPTGGTYTLTYGSETTEAIDYNDDGKEVEAALRELAGLETVEVYTTGTSPNFKHRVKFVSVEGNATTLSATSSLTGGSSPAVTITTLQTGSTQAMDDCIIEACEEINKHVYRYYTFDNLATSNLVNRWATVLSAHYLSERRGNPALFKDRVERIFDELKMVLDGKLQLPGIPMRRPVAGVWSNLRANIRYRFKVIRVRSQSSSSIGSTSTPVDWQEQYNQEF